MFDDPKKELKKLEQQLLDDEKWFQKELDSAKRMIGQVPDSPRRTSAPQSPQASRSTAQTRPAPAGKAPVKTPAKKKKKKSIQGLVILACVEFAGILALAAYWLLVLLK